MGLLKLIFGNSANRKTRRKKLETRSHKGYSQYKDKNGDWQYTHRRTAEKKVGGKIGKGRVVHHRDGNKRNNRPANLQVMSRSAHSKLHWWKRIFD